MKVLIAGLGSIGRRHLGNLQTLGVRDIILLRTFRSTMPDDELAGYPVETDLSSALAKKPDAVIVSVPTSLHMDVAIPAAEAGCHILLEKPVSHSMAQIKSFEDALERGAGKVLVGFQFRFHPGLLKVAELLKNGAVGRPLSARAVYAEYLPHMHPWEDYRNSYSARKDLGGGVILTLCHPVDYLRWLLGEFKTLWAFADQINDFEINVVDTAEIGFEFTNGVMGSVHLDYNRQPAAHTLEIIGTKGTILWDNLSGSTKVYSAQESAWQEFSIKSLRKGEDDFDRNEMFEDEMRHFLAIINDQEEPVCTLDDGVQALRIALAAHESAMQGNRVDIA